MFRILQSLLSSMSLERKCLILFGSSVLILMFICFFMVQLIAGSLVMRQTRQAGMDYADVMVARKHWQGINAQDLEPQERESNFQMLEILDGYLLSDTYEAELLMLEGSPEFTDMNDASLPANDAEREILQGLEKEFREEMTRLLETKTPTLSGVIDLGANDAFARQVPGQPRLYDEAKMPPDRYVLYVPIFSAGQENCLSACHTMVGGPAGGSMLLSAAEKAAQLPFRVVRVSMPNDETELTTTWIRAVLIAMAMLIIAVQLVALHTIVRYLVLRPMRHLRDVSDAISTGDTAKRAEIDTEDEFRELADAFNRMLRSLTETQESLRDVNQELDARVDQLAQLNLQLYEANRLKSDFLANMSHELRTPLNSIIGFSDVLRGVGSLTDKQRRYAENIQKSGNVLLEMINDILDLAKVEAGKMEVRLTDFNVADIVSAQSDMMRSLSEDKNIDLTVDFADALPTAHQDQSKIGQIVNNLLSNAIKFTPEGGVVRVSIDDLRDGRMRLLVADTGIGIAKEDQAVIFEKFRQSHAVLEGGGLTREFSGTGLGLSIVKELTKLLGGEVHFSSELGKGSTFCVTLPWRLQRPAAVVAPVVPPLSPSASSRQPAPQNP